MFRGPKLPPPPPPPPSVAAPPPPPPKPKPIPTEIDPTVREAQLAEELEGRKRKGKRSSVVSDALGDGDYSFEDITVLPPRAKLG